MAVQERSANTVWQNITEHEIVLLIREWFDIYGEPPRRIDWDPFLAARQGKPDLAVRFYEDGSVPPAHVVVRVFGTWTSAIIGAGFYPRVRTRAWEETNVEARSDYLRRAIQALKESIGD